MTAFNGQVELASMPPVEDAAIAPIGVAPSANVLEADKALIDNFSKARYASKYTGFPVSAFAGPPDCLTL